MSDVYISMFQLNFCVKGLLLKKPGGLGHWSMTEGWGGPVQVKIWMMSFRNDLSVKIDKSGLTIVHLSSGQD